MCGIVGAVANRDVWKILLAGLKRLEYRGYDSAGMAVLRQGEIHRLRRVGKVAGLEAALSKTPLTGHLGIAHTRWATHGEPTEDNAHPHISGRIAVVHNGIIENYLEFKQALLKEGVVFESQTDTEVIVHLLLKELKTEPSLLKAVHKVVSRFRGAYALGVLDQAHPDRIIGVRHGCPLVVGLGIDENFFASDGFALLPITQRFIYLEEGDIAELSAEQYAIYDAHLKPVTRAIHESQLSQDAGEKGAYRHYMLKEIFEQAEVMRKTLLGRVDEKLALRDLLGPKAPDILAKTQRIQIVACGTSYHAGLVARFWLESIAGIPCQVEIASELRYRQAVIEPGTLIITISQSGETADTLAALKKAKTISNYSGSLAICNVPESSLTRLSDLVMMTQAGLEIGVASTKAFTTQLLVLFIFTVFFAKYRKFLNESELKKYLDLLRELPHYAEKVLNLHAEITELAKFFQYKTQCLFLGRGVQFPIAMEGALKLKEISYIHAEAYPSGELKHGPLALVDKNMPVIVILPKDELTEKTKSTIEEVRARGGQMIVFADESLSLEENQMKLIRLPAIDAVLAPIIYTIPLQLLAYDVAVLKGTDVDQPRNLAKSVTVE